MRENIGVYFWLFNELVSLNLKAVISIFITSNLGFLLGIGNIVLFATVLQAMLGNTTYDYYQLLACILLVSLAYNFFTYITNVQQAKMAIEIQKKCHRDILNNVNNLDLSISDVKQLANRGARLTGQSVDDIFNIINYSIYIILVSGMMIYLKPSIYFWVIVTIFCTLPLVYKSKKNTNRISRKFFNSSSTALSSVYNYQFKTMQLNPSATKFRYYFKIFYEYKLISERLMLSTKTIQVIVFIVVLYLIYDSLLNEELKNQEPIIYLFLVKNFSAYLSHLLSYSNNLIKYFSVVESMRFNLNKLHLN